MAEEEYTAYHCREELESIVSETKYYTITIRGENLERLLPQEIRRSITLAVKSPSAPSLDEIPILAAVEKASYHTGLYVVSEPYEEEGGSREKRLASIVKRVLREGSPAIIVVPEPLAAGVMGHLDYQEASVLEESPKLHVEIEFTNHLYLPLRAPGGGIELVGKRNSAASYVRIERLEEMARQLGLNVASRVLLNSNSEIMEYVSELGPSGLLRRVPVTKLALYVRALSRCYPEIIGSLNPVRLREKGSHTIYFVKAPRRLVEAVERGLKAWESSRLHVSLASRFLGGYLRELSRLASMLNIP